MKLIKKVIKAVIIFYLGMFLIFGGAKVTAKSSEKITGEKISIAEVIKNDDTAEIYFMGKKVIEFAY